VSLSKDRPSTRVLDRDGSSGDVRFVESLSASSATLRRSRSHNRERGEEVFGSIV
jgi:hypothetical protein